MDIHKDLTIEYINQLWAEALTRYHNNESIYINDINILSIAERIQRSHLDENPLQNDIFNFLEILLPSPNDWYNMELSTRRRYIETVLNGEDTFKVLGYVGIYKRERVSVKEIMCEFYGYQINQPIERKMSLDVARSLVALGWNKTGSGIRIKPYGYVKIYTN